ncbi:hypothetical protein CDO73_04290 [Saccharibacillus sp. O23]|uniref:C40 family peptidase n=1 Tax=Saccharibacillus sp. O23 TaxID=2009338 RepID=UPI000B4E3064|nr:C40 family peptidase [Saccharibacillus sp. O23]OWR31709.1 hypothetical protein CDO73_04290 [Saccharibacillus sp. O23]
MKRNVFSLFAASALLVTVPVVAEASPGKVERPVNLRSAPSASEGSVYRTLQPGTKFEVLAEPNAYWLKVQAGDKVGYVSAAYVSYAKAIKEVSVLPNPAAASSSSSAASGKPAASTVKPASAPAAAPSSVKTPAAPAAPAAAAPSVQPSAQPTGSGVVTKNVNFRSQPVTGSDVYRVLPAGENFAAVELANSAWLKITDASGVTGYVSTGYVSYTLADGSTNADASATPSVPASAPSTVVSAPQTDDDSSASDPSLLLPPSGLPATGAVAPASADQIIASALSLQGITHYGFGKNEAPVLFDCSSFTRYVFGLSGVNIPVGTAYQKDVGIAVDKDQWQKGDLLFFWSSVPGLIGHVGIYDGEGHLVHNSASKNGVVVSDLSLQYWQDHYVSARRVLQ